MKQLVHNFKQGETVIAFDSMTWNKVGCDIGDNSQFWQDAEITQFRLAKPYDDGKKAYVADLYFFI